MRLRGLRRFAGAVEAAQVRRFGRSVVSVTFRTPVLLLHTIGRRSDRERATTLAYHRDADGSLLIVGGAGGQARFPDWVANLRANPSAAVTVDRSRYGVTASELAGEERQQVWRRLADTWPRIERYERRAGRPVPVIRLRPTAPFGDRVVPATGVIAARVESEFDMELLNLAGFPQYLRVAHGRPEVVDTIAEVAARHTSTPDSACFAIWEGYGWSGGPQYREVRTPRTVMGRAVAGVRERFERRVDHRRQVRERRQLDEQLSTIPRVELPNRSYHLLSGPVAAVGSIAPPGSPRLRQPPDLWWPEDLAWFVGTDIDVDHTVVGGSCEFIAELGRALPDPAPGDPAPTVS